MTEILITNYARRKSGWSAFGHGFDTRRLHHETLDNTEMCCRGLFILVLLIMNHTVDDVLLKGIKFYEKTFLISGLIDVLI